MDVDAARAFSIGLDLHTTLGAQSARWIEYLADQLEWAREEISSLRDREDATG
jgi:hypothetical protein